jgi:5-formyltetrahydrofolate cyclo-ligase
VTSPDEAATTPQEAAERTRLTKAALRQGFLTERANRSPEERAAAAAAVSDALLRGLAPYRTIAGFVPEPSEPGAGRLPEDYDELSARVLLPVIPSSGRELMWAVANGVMETGRYGLLEPAGHRFPPSELGEAEVIVMPAVAISRQGVRLGRGGGYYDTSLVHAGPDVHLVALVFDNEFVDDLPDEPHDRRVTAVVTPSGGWQALPVRR